MKTRVIVAAVGLPVFLIILLALPPMATALLVAAMAVVAVYELLYGTGLVKSLPLVILSMIMALSVSLWCSGSMLWQEAIIGLWLYTMVLTALLLVSHGQLPFGEVAVSVFAGLILPLLLSALTRIRFLDHGTYYVLVPLVLCFGTDTAAYFVGCAVGKHKMAPIISPKKSWEGAAGGVIGGIVLMFLYTLVLDTVFGQQVQYGAAFVYGILGCATCVMGDLLFSVIKRQTGIKDYGKLLPGHGGILDRFDSMVLVAPLAEALLLTMPLIIA